MLIDKRLLSREKVIGEGAGGQVWKGTLSGNTVAIKELSKVAFLS